jgi:nitroreductase
MNMKPDQIKFKIQSLEGEALVEASQKEYELMSKRRTVRDFSERTIPETVIHNLIMTASTAPSGANKQPWTFCVVTNPDTKRKIRVEAEKEEYESYNGRMPDEMLSDLEQLGTNWEKPFLEIAPVLIVVFKKVYDLNAGEKSPTYYPNESVGIASGFLLQAIHRCGLVALTHTPSPMKFLTKILDRPENERPFLLIPVGYPAEDVMVPNIRRKSSEDVIVNYR